MSKDKKNKASTAVNEFRVSQTNSELIEKPKIEEEFEKPKDGRAIEIILDVIENVKAFHQVCYVHVKSEYNGKVVDVSEKTLIIDEKVKLNWCFYIDVDVLCDKDLDDLVSKPLIFTIYQTPGDFDPEFFNQMHLFEEIGHDSKSSFDSAISVYELFTGEVVEDKETVKEFSKTKKTRRISEEHSAERLVSKEDLSSTPKEKSKSKKSDKSSTKSKKIEDPDAAPSPSKLSQKMEENSVVIGMGTMDMLPLILGNQKFDASVDLKPLVSYDDDRMMTFRNIPKMCVTVLIDKPIEFPMKPTILGFTVESIFNIPQAMSSPEMECRICAWVPFTDNFDMKQIFGNSVFISEDIEYQMKAWPNIPVIGDNVNATKYRIRREFDNVRYNSSKSISSVIKKNNPKLVYNYIRRNIMTDLNKTVLHNYLLRYRYILLEIYLAEKDVLPPLDADEGPKRSSTKVETKKKGKSSGFLHLMALVDISSLVYPGVTSTRVACQLSTYHEKEVLRATGIQDSFFLPKPKSTENLHQVSDKSLKKVEHEKDKGLKRKQDASNTSISTKKGGNKTDRSTDDNLKNTLPLPPTPEVEEEPSMKIFNENGDPTIIIIEIEIAEPLVKARPAEDLITSLKELIPVKPILPKTALSIKVVEENYKQVIQDMGLNLNEHFTKYIQEKKICHCSSQADFLTYLRRIGVYQKYIITLRKAIAVLISKKYDVLDFAFRRSSKKHQDLIGKFFVYLVSRMNTILNKQNCAITARFMEGLSSMDATLFYAKESCELKRYTCAEKYFMERLCLQEDNPDVWFDYALFQIEMDSPELAFEYLKEALSKRLDHTNSLVLYGILLTEKGKMSDAETCFMTVLVHRPRWVEGWGILFLFYQKNKNAGGMAFAEDMARQYLNDERTEQDYFMKNDELIWTSEILPRTVFFKTAVVLLKLRMYYWVEDALAFEIASHPGKVNYLLAVICFFQENYDHALDHLKEAKLIEGWNYAVVALTGHCLVWKHEYEAAREEFFYVLNAFDRPDDIHMLYIDTAKVLSILGKEQEARQIMLLACKSNPTPYTWTIAGTFFYNENDFLSAEECFTEANICNNRIPQVWAFLTLINLKLDRETEAELCYQQAMKNELDDASLIFAIAEEIASFQKRNYECDAQFTIGQEMF
ncbi:cilia- and flagella-associated protein 70-like [Coccinella septempunctata]|uniref:cilia- and flagella-associated protein 70-like n=1 Tax=Coccinella septempunctata TaxID=41139 RepID=UPI001D068448|nr:cilia- and flagella-associated protein 70-like [Coccinella septempunctata]